MRKIIILLITNLIITYNSYASLNGHEPQRAVPDFSKINTAATLNTVTTPPPFQKKIITLSIQVKAKYKHLDQIRHFDYMQLLIQRNGKRITIPDISPNISAITFVEGDLVTIHLIGIKTRHYLPFVIYPKTDSIIVSSDAIYTNAWSGRP